MIRKYGFFFFFSSRRRHTRLQGDWSSDVWSSDLDADVPRLHVRVELAHLPVEDEAGVRVELLLQQPGGAREQPLAAVDLQVEAELALARLLADLVDLRRGRQHLR